MVKNEKSLGSLNPEGRCSGCNVRPKMQDRQSAFCPTCRVWFLKPEDLKKIRPTLDGKEATYKQSPL